uniref:Uncharacterized protein n=1 Tax=Utricularia reniformis TaxID=192314 RepID=A0A1Y0B3N9_9LAMI|nr:hypothetical protein AEK19_MT1832 [Utricularia reniformis]ART32003.1 hypothetical protein AEK19_MT1832 [Utricularia reniformis]
MIYTRSFVSTRFTIWNSALRSFYSTTRTFRSLGQWRIEPKVSLLSMDVLSVLLSLIAKPCQDGEGHQSSVELPTNP